MKTMALHQYSYQMMERMPIPPANARVVSAHIDPENETFQLLVEEEASERSPEVVVVWEN